MNRFISVIFILLTACRTTKPSANAGNLTKNQVDNWFEKKEWLGGLDLLPHSSINKKEFASRYHRNKERFDKAFLFLKNSNLSTLKAGDLELEGRNLFVRVSEYNSKELNDALFETHKTYTDIHLVVNGEEYIGVTDSSELIENTPYDPNKEIQFHRSKNSRNLIAKPNNFFLFFPGEPHSPGLKIEKSIPVKKIVIKLKN